MAFEFSSNCKAPRGPEGAEGASLELMDLDQQKRVLDAQMARKLVAEYLAVKLRAELGRGAGGAGGHWGARVGRERLDDAVGGLRGTEAALGRLRTSSFRRSFCSRLRCWRSGRRRRSGA